jgi:hypothetical protein
MVDPCHMIDVRNPGCQRTAVIFALQVGRTSNLTGLPKTLNGRGGRGFHGALTTAPPAPRKLDDAGCRNAFPSGPTRAGPSQRISTLTYHCCETLSRSPLPQPDCPSNRIYVVTTTPWTRSWSKRERAEPAITRGSTIYPEPFLFSIHPYPLRSRPRFRLIYIHMACYCYGPSYFLFT